MPFIVRDTVNKKNVVLGVDELNQLSVKDSAMRLSLDELNTTLDTTFGSVVTLKDSVGMGSVGAYQFVSSEITKRGQKITLLVKSEQTSTSWTCEIGQSFDNVSWITTNTNINAVALTQQLHEFSLIAPYWRLVFVNTIGYTSVFTIQYI